MNHTGRTDVVSVIKEWAAPSLVAVVGIFIWRDLSELRDDVKFLITQQTASQVKIESLESKVNTLERDMNNFKYMLYRGNRDAKLEDSDFAPVPELLDLLSQ